MSIFKDPTGRRGRAVRAAAMLGIASVVAAAGAFLVSLFPGRWDPARSQNETPGSHAGNVKLSPLEAAAREKAYKKEKSELKKLMRRAQEAQQRRSAADPAAPVLAAFAVNWDPGSRSARRMAWTPRWARWLCS